MKKYILFISAILVIKVTVVSSQDYTPVNIPSPARRSL